MNNGGCSHVCTNPLNEGEDVTCSCENTPLVIDPNGSAFQCGKSSLISYTVGVGYYGTEDYGTVVP